MVMHKIAFSIFGFGIHYYSLCILLGVLVAYYIINKELEKFNISSDDILNLIFYGLIVGIIGARIYYLIFNLDYYLNYPQEIIAIYNGGLAIHGGLLFGAVFVYFYSKKIKINFVRLLDVIAPAVIIAQAIGRWGNFFNQEAYGSVTTLLTLKKMHIPGFIIKGMYIDGMYYLPTFYVESIWCIIGFLIMQIMKKTRNLNLGTLSGFYLLWYGIGRLFIEYFRTDSLMLLNLKVAELVSILFIVSGIIILLISKNKKMKYKEGEV